MPAPKIQSNQIEKSAMKRTPLYVNPELKGLIVELMLPRFETLRTIVSTRFVSEEEMANEKDDADDDDWWPDYRIYSDKHYMTEMNGLMHLILNGLRGMTDELQTIGLKFQAFILDNFKPDQSAKKVAGANPAEGKEDILNRYLLAQSLIKDMVNFVTCCSRQCTKLLKQRKAYFDRASETKDTEDRIRLKVFDERSFTELHGRMISLKSFVQDFCNLFESEWNSSDQQGISVVSPTKKIST
ncbi:PREDICTED: uncharacterized protein LOC108613654 [Drosophila arizonae]|uniref:Uncharacterized protein LOC108613654 n=1 Tax=Drosophila arizonae TaxID=7263 RepID=A0ABM1P689_DROAR|nr:PREDICTED: uncharacterized protein LOC108613654 [Drosophila arizonae]